MSRLRRLTLPQRVVLVLGLGAVFVLVGVYVAAEGLHPGGGWFGYAPEVGFTDTYYAVRRVNPWRILVVPLALTVVWTAFSVWLLGTPADRTKPDASG